MRYVPLILPNFFALRLFILAFVIYVTVHQQLVAILRGLMRLSIRFEIFGYTKNHGNKFQN